jgi:hypothetical protein
MSISKTINGKKVMGGTKTLKCQRSPEMGSAGS